MATGKSFNAFFEGWLARQQAFLDQLVNDINNNNNSNNNGDNESKLIERVLSHYTEYYEEKARVIWQDIFLLFSPPWLTSIEKTFLWVGGFKPSIAFCLVEASSASIEQVQNLSVVKAETIREERELTDALAMVQESVGSQPLMTLMKRYAHGRLIDGAVYEFEKAMDEMRESMAKVVQRADDLRRKTVMKVLEILNKNQSLKFLAAVAKYQLGIRAWGLQNEAQRN